MYTSPSSKVLSTVSVLPSDITIWFCAANTKYPFLKQIIGFGYSVCSYLGLYLKLVSLIKSSFLSITKKEREILSQTRL